MNIGSESILRDSALGGSIRSSRFTSKRSKSKIRSYLQASYAFSFVFNVVACLLLQFLYSDFAVWILIPSFLFLSLIGAVLTRSGMFGIHACVLTYSICVLVSALAQNYSSANFGSTMSTIDANLFYRVVLNKSLNTMEELGTVVNAPLATYIWKLVYKIFGSINESGPLPGVLFNASLLGIAGALTIKSGRILFGDEARRLYKVGILFSANGLVWLFGALFLRDGFALFFNTLALWAILKWLNKPSVLNLVVAGCVVALSGFAMEYIREGSWHLFMGLAALAIGVGFLRGKNPIVKLSVLGVASIVVVVGYSVISDQINSALHLAENREQAYSKWSAAGGGSDSLGVAFVTSQPLPIRATIGSIYMLLTPIPSWGYLQPGLQEYYLIKGCHAVYMLLIVPLLMAGIAYTVKSFLNGRARNLNYTYIAIYFAATVMIVAATSLETRHVGQFSSGMVLLAAIPRINTKAEMSIMRKYRIIWLITVAAIHLVWAGLKFLR